ncbi:DUF6090 family protein [Thalassomonas sp. M1454]|uniref:DUF6090 family protein n=1 Tax=Thalassomonas sp. M1454 TaxID=2594477 RepID=UPI00117FE77B|nr:DUF6090 family protein [Thalassomonas sp. M1454]TRX56953.1 hypothetical protein FNN08_05430 [Thalassomonas sp. M1454]
MLLRKITHHLKEQNWFAAWLDLLIVILGILIGLQVNSWNETRKEKALETIYLKRFVTELKVDLQVFDDSKVRNQYRIEGVDALIDAIENGFETNRDDLIHLLKYIKRIEIIIKANTGTATWNEIVSTGRLDLIQDQKLKASISNHYQIADRVRRENLMFNSTELRLDQILDRWFTLKQTLYFANLQYDKLSSEDITEILNKAFSDKEFLTVLSSFARKLYLANRIMSRNEVKTQNLINHLEKTLQEKEKR